MKKGALFFVLILLALNLPWTAASSSRYGMESTYTFENRGGEAFVLTDDDAGIPLFLDSDWQTVKIANSSHGLRDEDTDIDGNRYAVVDIPLEIAPGASVTFWAVYDIQSNGRPEPNIDPAKAGTFENIPEGLVDEYCFSTDTFMADDEGITAFAERLSRGETTVLGAVARYTRWLLENATYANFETPRYPNETLADGRGDCDDQAILLISMCRSVGIPAFLQVGVVFYEGIDSSKTSWEGHLSIEQKGVGWHGWAMIYVPPWGWLPVDLTLTNLKDPIDLLENAPEYGDFVVAAYNISGQDYVGNSTRQRERIVGSDLYISVSDAVVDTAPTGQVLDPLMISIAFTIVGALALIYVLSRRKRPAQRGAPFNP